jgi:hypothetical protein
MWPFAFILVLLLGFIQLILGAIGLENVLGWWASAGALFLVAYARMTLPLSIGSYFAMVNVFEYPWWVGVLVAAPGLLFMVPAVLADVISSVKKRI